MCVMLVGVSLVSYPFLSDWLNQRAQDEVSRIQEQVVAQASVDTLSGERTAATDYNTRLLDGSSHVLDPFDPDDTSPGTEEYEKVLNVAQDGVMGRLVIPSINVDLPIHHYTTEETLAHGVGHVVNTSVPIGGPSTHSVMAAHTGLPTSRLFDRLIEVGVGDWFIVRVLGEDHAYMVESTEVVLPEEVESMAVTRGEDLVTLVTCTPYGVNSHRLLVHARRTELPPQWNAEEPSMTRSVTTPTDVMPTKVWAAASLGAAVAIGLIVLFLIIRLVRDRRR